MARLRGWWLQGLLVLVVGGLVLMHGADPAPGATHAGATSVMVESSGHDAAATRPAGERHDDRGGHLAALCVAVLGSAAAVRLGQRRLLRPSQSSSLLAARDTRPALVAPEALGPPGLGPPVLAVPRC